MEDTARKRHLRKFGLIMSVPFLILSGFLFYKGRPAAPYLLAPGVLLAVLGLLRPGLLDPVEKGWMWFAGKLQIVSTTIILSAAYYLVLTPTGLVMRLFGRDALHLRKKDRETYWVPADKDGSANRPMKPY